jgi:CBS domain containing-hemolysin-like protein
MILLVLYVTLAIGVSFMCSIMEAVLLSVTPAYIGALQKERPHAAARLQSLKDDIDRPLAAILSLNTVAHTMGAAGAGAQAAAVFGSTAIGLFSALLTLAILVLSEIIPKTIGALYWRHLASGVARILGPMIWLLYPLVWFSQSITGLISRGRDDEGEASREELVAMADIGEQRGSIEALEARIVKSLMRFNGLTAKDVMTPRTVLVTFPESAAAAEVTPEDVLFSRIPVFAEDPDQITGYVLRDDVLQAVAEDRHEEPLTALRREILVVPEAFPLPRVFAELLSRREHIALVLAPYGGTQGIVTMEDVIETLLGLEIMDEVDQTENMRQLARRRWEERAAQLGLLSEDFERDDEA